MRFIPHPAMQIMLWAMLALLVQQLHPLPLAGMSLVLLVLALKLSSQQLLKLLRRTRWILFSLFLIYAYTTAGNPVVPALGLASPTQEGLLDGAVQLARLLCVLSSLAILLTWLPLEKLISGLYTLAYPLSWLGLSRERIAVRLALTLEKAEATMGETARDWRSTIEGALQVPQQGGASIELALHRFGMVDGVLLVAAIVVVAGVWQ